MGKKMDIDQKTRDLYITCNRQVNLVYILAGVLEMAIEDSDDYLKRTGQKLLHLDKFLINDLIRADNKIIHIINKVKEQAVLSLGDPENIRLYKDSVVKYYSLFMRFVETAGVDDFFEIRAYVLISILNEFIPHITFPNLEVVEIKAWSDIYLDIVKGKYSPEEIEKLMPKYSRDEIEAAKAECKI